MEEEFTFSGQASDPADTLDSNGLPVRLAGIKVGDIVCFRSASKLNDATYDIRCRWSSKMNFLCGQEFAITEEMMEKISKGRTTVHIIPFDGANEVRDYWCISLDMLEFAKKDAPVEQEVVKINFSFVKETDDVIAKEMIALIDKDRFKKLLVIGGGSNSVLKKLDAGTVDKYLEDWAKAKQNFYLMFGKKLLLSKEIEIDMTETEVSGRVKDACYAFPQFAPLLLQFSNSEWLGNSISRHSSVLSEYCKDMYSNGTKVTKFLSQIAKSKELDDYLATKLSNRKVRDTIFISIDPYDYLTMSYNNHGWNSCHQLGSGSYSPGCASLMLDDYTLIGYKSSGKNSSYSDRNYKWEGNSKTWRQCIYLDPKTSSAIFSRQYPQEIPDVTKELRALLEEKLSSALGFENSWRSSTGAHHGYQQGSSLPYHDVLNGRENHKMIRPKLLPDGEATTFIVGKDIYCIHCGLKTSRGNGNFLCGSCE